MTGGVGVGVGDGGGDDTTTAGSITSVNVFDADVPAVAVTVTLKLPDVAGNPDAFRMVAGRIVGNTEAIAWGTSAGSASGASSTSHTPSGKSCST